MSTTQKVIIGVGIFLIIAITYSLTTFNIFKEPEQIGGVKYFTLKSGEKVPENGIYTEKYPSGKIKTEYALTNFALNGVTKNYYENGGVESEFTYRNGKKNGLAKSFLENGTLSALLNFKNDKSNGEAKEYYKTGELKAIENYDSDKLVARTRFTEDGRQVFHYENKGELPFKSLANLIASAHTLHKSFVSLIENKTLNPEQLIKEITPLYYELQELIYVAQKMIPTENNHLLQAKELLVKSFSSQFDAYKVVLNGEGNGTSVESEWQRLLQESDDYAKQALDKIKQFGKEAGDAISINPFKPLPKSFPFSLLGWLGWFAVILKEMLWACIFIGIPIGVFLAYLLAFGSFLGKTYNARIKKFAAGQLSSEKLKNPTLDFAYGVHLILLLPFLYILLLFCPVLAITFSGLPIYLILNTGYVYWWLFAALLVVGGMSIVAALIGMFGYRKRNEFGIVISDKDEPELMSIIRSVANDVGAKPIDQVIITPVSGVGVYLTGGLFHLLFGQTKRVLRVGMVDLSSLSVSEFKVILAHEYGHFSNKDTAWNSLTFTNVGILQNALESMPRPSGDKSSNLYNGLCSINPVLWTLIFYRFVLSIFTNGFSRIGEVLADKRAIETYGQKSFIDGLKKIARDQNIFNTFGSPGAIAKTMVNENKVITNLYEYFSKLKDSLSDEDKRNIDKKVFDEEVESLHDSHPLLRDRFEYAKYFTSAKLNVEDEIPARNMISNWEETSVNFTKLYNTSIYSVVRHLMPATEQATENEKSNEVKI